MKKEETLISPQNSIIADEHVLSSTITDDHQSFHSDEQMIVDDSHNSSSIRSDQYPLRPKDYINDEITINEDIPLSNVSTTKNFESSSPNISLKKETDRKDISTSLRGSSFVLPTHFWEKFWVGGGKPLRKSWVDAFNAEFEKKYPFCVLAISWHKCKDKLSRSTFFFQVARRCKHSMCVKLKFFVTDSINVFYTDKIMHVYVSGQVSHGKERYRNIRGKERAALADELEKSAIVVKLKMLAKTDDEILRAGNLNKTPTSDILHKISSENRAKRSR